MGRTKVQGESIVTEKDEAKHMNSSVDGQGSLVNVRVNRDEPPDTGNDDFKRIPNDQEFNIQHHKSTNQNDGGSASITCLIDLTHNETDFCADLG